VKVLVVTDKVVDFIYSPRVKQNLGDVELILSCGDLPYYYLDYIMSMLDVPLFYVHGNHDVPIEYSHSGKECTYPPGGANVHLTLSYWRGLSVVGLEGSIRYKPDGAHQYTNSEMWQRAFLLAPLLLYHRAKTGKPVDVLLTHAPAYAIHDGKDRAHVGFRSFLWLMRQFAPRYLLHGHRHVYDPLEVTETRYHRTTIINAYPYKVLEIGIDEP
jgi:uncharacterized protein